MADQFKRKTQSAVFRFQSGLVPGLHRKPIVDVPYVASILRAEVALDYT
jgi:hypothetical protein